MSIIQTMNEEKSEWRKFYFLMIFSGGFNTVCCDGRLPLESYLLKLSPHRIITQYLVIGKRQCLWRAESVFRRHHVTSHHSTITNGARLQNTYSHSADRQLWAVTRMKHVQQVSASLVYDNSVFREVESKRPTNNINKTLLDKYRYRVTAALTPYYINNVVYKGFQK